MKLRNALLPLAERIAAVTPDSHRALPAEDLCRRLREEYGYTTAVPYGSLAEGLEALRCDAGEEDVICICGSLYMIGEARALFDRV